VGGRSSTRPSDWRVSRSLFAKSCREQMQQDDVFAGTYSGQRRSYCGAVAALVIASSAAAIALRVASPSWPNPCRFASQFGSL